MSDPPKTPYTVGAGGGAGGGAGSSSSSLALYEPAGCSSQPPPAMGTREYRKGNWTVQETLTLITAKRLDDDRRSSNSASTPTKTLPLPSSSPRSAEQRWKWVENYCWAHDCLRSQNQCNDKWDNLLRDYKKVRDYESKLLHLPDLHPQQTPTYWAMDRPDRKDRNLPTNLSREVFDALTHVLTRRNARRTATPVSSRPPPPPLQLPPPPPPPMMMMMTTAEITAAAAAAEQYHQQPPPPPTQPSVSGN